MWERDVPFPPSWPGHGGWDVLRVEWGAGAAAVLLLPGWQWPWQWPRAEGQGGGDLEQLLCSREKPFPVGILITCHLMACLCTPPSPPPRHTLVSPTDASGVPPPRFWFHWFRTRPGRRLLVNPQGLLMSNQGWEPSLKLEAFSSLYNFMFLSHNVSTFICFFPFLLDCGLPDGIPNNARGPS